MEFTQLIDALGRPVKVQVTVKPEWCPQGQTIVMDGQMIRVAHNPAPFIEDEGPAKIILVADEREAFRVKETIREIDTLELWEDDDAA